MFEWLISNLATILISLVLLSVVALITVNFIKNKKKGRTSCGCGCENCAMSGSCHGSAK